MTTTPHDRHPVRRLLEVVTGSWDEKRLYREYKARVGRLPDSYAAAVDALERYLAYYGGITDGKTLVTMLDDLAVLFEQGAADGTPIRTIVGEDPAEFAETFLRNYAERQWINRERQRLVAAIDTAAGDRGKPAGEPDDRD